MISNTTYQNRFHTFKVRVQKSELVKDSKNPTQLNNGAVNCRRRTNSIWELHCLAKLWIYLTPYVCTERFFDCRPFMYNKIFLKKLLLKLVAHIFTLLLAPFALKLVYYLRSNEILNFRKNSKSSSFSFEDSDFTVFKHFSKTQCASKNWPIWT